jgi:hypothetical protein
MLMKYRLLRINSTISDSPVFIFRRAVSMDEANLASILCCLKTLKDSMMNSDATNVYSPLIPPVAPSQYAHSK